MAPDALSLDVGWGLNKWPWANGIDPDRHTAADVSADIDRRALSFRNSTLASGGTR
ncbi:MAG: hypothetical protein OXJ37_21815 [Bryobacterales bacterium]|nr:hypothetical protein [Bryobacterales bacterium]